MDILKNIHSPDDVKKLPGEQLPELAKEIRSVIIDVTSKNGGHVAPSLGVVELTIALHRVFKTPEDKIVWDVGHQAYAHKLLTGRADRFHTLRQHGGLSGFPRRKESPHDAFSTGHSSTSIAAASGILESMRKRGDKGKVIAVIGDGSMTGGLAFEALNYAGHRRQDLVVVLNDNEMSISKNVGAIAAFLSRKFHSPSFTSFRSEVKKLINTIPSMGNTFIPIIKRAEESLMGFLTPGILFEAFGFNYIGPVDGHDMRALIPIFREVATSKDPTLIHVLTKKGHGYAPAEQQPTLFHGVGPYEIESGDVVKSAGKVTYTEAFSNALMKLAREDQRIVALTAAMSSGTGLDKFAIEFPNRFYDVGIAESYATLFAAGMATQGQRPVFAVYSSFLQRAYDQLVHDVCLQKLPVVFAIDRAGVVGDDGTTHQGLFDISFLRHIPNMTVMAPKDENELGHMLKTALSIDGPVAVRYPRGTGVGCAIETDHKELPVGRMEVVYSHREPSAVIFAVGPAVYTAEAVARKLVAEGVCVDVVNARFIKPLDAELVRDYASRVNDVFTLEENIVAGGFGSAVLECIAESGHHPKCHLIGIPDIYVEHGKQSILREKYGLDEDGIYKRMRSALSGEVEEQGGLMQSGGQHLESRYIIKMK